MQKRAVSVVAKIRQELPCIFLTIHYSASTAVSPLLLCCCLQGGRRELRRRGPQGRGGGPLQQQGGHGVRPPQAGRVRVRQQIRQRRHIGERSQRRRASKTCTHACTAQSRWSTSACKACDCLRACLCVRPSVRVLVCYIWYRPGGFPPPARLSLEASHTVGTKLRKLPFLLSQTTHLLARSLARSKTMPPGAASPRQRPRQPLQEPLPAPQGALPGAPPLEVQIPPSPRLLPRQVSLSLSVMWCHAHECCDAGAWDVTSAGGSATTAGRRATCAVLCPRVSAAALWMMTPTIYRSPKVTE